MQVTVCAVDPSSDQLTSIQLPADASLTDAAQMLGNALTEDDSAVNQYWVNLDPESQDDIIPRLPHGDPIFEINLVLLSARPGGKRCCPCSRFCNTFTLDCIVCQLFSADLPHCQGLCTEFWAVAMRLCDSPACPCSYCCNAGLMMILVLISCLAATNLVITSCSVLFTSYMPEQRIALRR